MPAWVGNMPFVEQEPANNANRCFAVWPNSDTNNVFVGIRTCTVKDIVGIFDGIMERDTFPGTPKMVGSPLICVELESCQSGRKRGGEREGEKEGEGGRWGRDREGEIERGRGRGREREGEREGKGRREGGKGKERGMEREGEREGDGSP